MTSPRSARLGVLVVVLSLGTGCVRYARADASNEAGRFDALWQRDLSALEHQVAVERHTGSHDDWTELAQAWLDFVNCEEIELEDHTWSDPLASYLHATLVAEQTRRALAIYRGGRSGLRDAALFAHVAVPQFFAREGDDIDADVIQWPAANEGWVDEVPARRDVTSSCDKLRERVSATRLRPDDDDSPRRTFQDWFDAYLAAVDVVAARFGELERHGADGAPRALDWSTRMWIAVLKHETGLKWQQFADAARDKAERGVSAQENLARAKNGDRRAEELRQSAHDALHDIAEHAPEGVPAAQHARARLLLAAYEVDAERPGKALELLAAARVDGLDEENFWAARYLELRVASGSAQWDTAAELAGGLPPRTSRYHGAYYYRVAVATKRIGQDDRFLNVAMKAFRDRPYKADPFLRALYWEMLQTLADYPFDARVIELLEDMGHRGDTSERVEEYARAALDRGQAANADAAARWLLSRHHDSRFHPRYQGIIALAAFVDDDVERFEKASRAITERPGALRDALPARRQSSFFAPADAELARVLRQMLPVMAEWGDDRSAQDRRQRWLRVIVTQTQQFVRNTEDTLARPQLLELYRLASALLDDHPRGYAERVGEQEPAPLVLGTVRVHGRDLEQHEPEVELRIEAPYSLTLIPRDGLPPSLWPRHWPREESP